MLAPRAAVGVWSALIAVGLGLAAAWLPWRPSGVLTGVLGGLALAHAVTAILCAAGHRLRGAAWTAQSLLVLLGVAVLVVEVISSSLVLSRIYDGIGVGVGIALGLGLVALTAPVLPLAIWGVVASRRARVAAAVLAGVAAIAVPVTSRDAASRPMPRIERGLSMEAAPPAPAAPSARAATCQAPPSPGVPTAFVTSPSGISCLQADTAGALRARVLEELALAGRPAAVDEVVDVGGVPSLALAALDGLVVRPGVDGVCAGSRCRLPWQLVAEGAFAATRPLPIMPDLHFGVSLAALGGRLRGDVDQRIATSTTVLSADGAWRVLDRGRSSPGDLSPEVLAVAGAAAERYILAAQQPDGRFLYQRDPASGRPTMGGYGVPRQAGTTLALCELGASTPAVAEVARRSLEVLVRDTSRAPPDVRHLGPMSLTLAALITCRPRVGGAFDGDIATLAASLLAMARPDGRFDHRYDARTGAPVPGPDELYAAGQAMLALVLIENLGASVPGLPPPDAVHLAVERGMDYTASDYWPSFLRPLFFLEENWHCLAARAALAHHRHDGYERFCLDYAAARHRFLLGDGVTAAYRGGMGFGNIVPPQSTPTAGQGEVLAAAVALRAARGEPGDTERDDLRRVLTFLVRHQWRAADCFWCAAPEAIAGGFSESLSSPTIRIDYVQHAWAAIAHGARSLAM